MRTYALGHSEWLETGTKARVTCSALSSLQAYDCASGGTPEALYDCASGGSLHVMVLSYSCGRTRMHPTLPRSLQEGRHRLFTSWPLAWYSTVSYCVAKVFIPALFLQAKHGEPLLPWAWEPDSPSAASQKTQPGSLGQEGLLGPNSQHLKWLRHSRHRHSC